MYRTRPTDNPLAHAYRRRLGDPVFENVGRLPRSSFRWHQHGYPDPVARWGYHPEYELHLITASSGRYVVGDHIGRFVPGNLVLTGPNLPHAWISDLPAEAIEPGRDVVIQFRGEWLQQLMELCPELQVLDSLLTRAVRGIEFSGAALPRQIERMLELGRRSEGERLSGLLDLLHGLLDCDQHCLASPHYRLDVDYADSARVDAILDYIQQSLTRPLRMSELARLHGMSESGFSRFFSQAVGCTFVSYLRQRRIEQACRFLLDTSHSVAQIGFAVGYGNLSNFNRHFLAQTALTPSEYRRQMSLPSS